MMFQLEALSNTHFQPGEQPHWQIYLFEKHGKQLGKFGQEARRRVC